LGGRKLGRLECRIWTSIRETADGEKKKERKRRHVPGQNSLISNVLQPKEFEKWF